MTSSLVIDAFKMAVRHCRPASGWIRHSDRGSQYTGSVYQQLLKDNHCCISMSGKGNYYDIAPAESFFGSLKVELVHHTIYNTRDQARADIFCYIEAF